MLLKRISIGESSCKLCVDLWDSLSNIYDGAFLRKQWIAKSSKRKCSKGSLLRSRILLVDSPLFIVTAL